MIKAKLFVVLFSLCLLFNCIIEVDAQTKRRRTPRSSAAAAAITTPSGLTYLITKKGTGRQPKTGETVVVHYTGMLTNGVTFDSSREHNEPFAFKLGAGQVIKGYDEGFSKLRVGDHAILIIPSNLAYGSKGAGGVIPPDSTLISSWSSWISNSDNGTSIHHRFGGWSWAVGGKRTDRAGAPGCAACTQ